MLLATTLFTFVWVPIELVNVISMLRPWRLRIMWVNGHVPSTYTNTYLHT